MEYYSYVSQSVEPSEKKRRGNDDGVILAPPPPPPPPPPPVVAGSSMVHSSPGPNIEAQQSTCVPTMISVGEDEETECILKIMSQHAEHRGPREIGSLPVAQDNLARRYFKGRAWQQQQQLPPGGVLAGAGLAGVPEDYVCHMCGEKGHHIRACPKRQGKNQTKKIRAATGIPRSWLEPIAASQIAEYDSVFSLPNGQLAVLKPEAGANVTGLGGMTAHNTNSASSSVSTGGGDPLSPQTWSTTGDTANGLLIHMRCPLCTESFKEATLVSCCGSTFCRDCITNRLGLNNNKNVKAPPTSTNVCPACGFGPLAQSDLEPNLAVQQSLEAATKLAGTSGMNGMTGPVSTENPAPPPASNPLAAALNGTLPPKSSAVPNPCSILASSHHSVHWNDSPCPPQSTDHYPHHSHPPHDHHHHHHHHHQPPILSTQQLPIGGSSNVHRITFTDYVPPNADLCKQIAQRVRAAKGTD